MESYFESSKMFYFTSSFYICTNLNIFTIEIVIFIIIIFYTLLMHVKKAVRRAAGVFWTHSFFNACQSEQVE